MSDKPQTGSIGWCDLTVEHGEQIRDFYARVTGWKSEDHSMGEYSDYMMKMPDTDTPVAGICHARGQNSNLPPQWLIYVQVADLDSSLKSCVDLGGKVISPARSMGDYGTVAVIQDPAGAVLALTQSPSAE